MNINDHLLILLIGATIGVVFGWLFVKIKYSFNESKKQLYFDNKINSLSESLKNKNLSIQSLEKTMEENHQKISSLSDQLSQYQIQNAQLKTIVIKERSHAAEKIELLKDLRKDMTQVYQSISLEALQKNNKVFIETAEMAISKYISAAQKDFNVRGEAVKETIKPLKDALIQYDQNIREMERYRENAYGGLSEQVNSLIKTQSLLHKETGRLVKALQVPHVRGRWGEITLKRVAELSGMANHCDFFEQKSVQTKDGLLRPDMVVRLPGQRQIIIDSKVPLAAYLDALEAETDKARKILLQKHTQQVRSHVQKLSRKAYWSQFEPSPEFVVLFIPGENFFSAALAYGSDLIEQSAKQNVILATPTTLISLLKVISYAWHKEQASENAKAIAQLGHELYNRIFTISKHLKKLGRQLDQSSATYNTLIGSYEHRVLSSARKFETLGVSLMEEKKLTEMIPVERKIHIE